MKKRRRTYKIILIIATVLFALPATAYVFLQSKKIQNAIIQKITSNLSEELKARITVREASVNLFNRIRLTDLYVEDLNRDTLIFSPEVRIGLKKFIQKERILSLSKIEFKNPRIYFRIDTAGTLNFQYIIDELNENKSQGQKKKKMSLTIQNIDILDGVFTLSNETSKSGRTGIDFSDILLENLNLAIDDLHLQHDTALFIIDYMQFREKSGFKITGFTSELSVSKRHMLYNKLKMQTQFSDLNFETLQLEFDSFSDLRTDSIFSNVNLVLDCQPSRLAITDLSYFAEAIPPLKKHAVLSGNFKGKLENLKAKDLVINYGSTTHLRGDFDINGLPDVSATFVFFDIKQLITSPLDIQSIYREFYDVDFDISETFRNLERIDYTGKFTGFFDDFVTYGDFQTALGNISTDLLIRPASQKKVMYSGNLKTDDFQLGKLININKEILNRFSGDLNIKGESGDQDRIDAMIDGHLDLLEINNYPYKNIRISGRLLDNFFDGFFDVNDPNLDMAFNGKIDFNEENTDFDFTADVTQAHLYNLNIDKTNPSSFASFLLKANGSGKNLDELNGEVRLVNSLFSKDDKQIQVYDMEIVAYNSTDSNHLMLRSDMVDAELTGLYEIKQLPAALKKTVHTYAPAFFPESSDYELIGQNNFTFQGEIKRMNDFNSFFLPNLKIAENTSFYGEFNPSDSLIKFHVQSNNISYKNYVWENIFVNVFNDNSSLSFELGSRFFKFSEDIQLENYSIQLDAKNDSLDFLTRWHNWDSTLYKGSIKAMAVLKEKAGNGIPAFHIVVPSSEIIIEDSLWQIGESEILIDTTSIRVNDFKIVRNHQQFMVNGLLSANPEDRLSFVFEDFKLDNFNLMLNKDNFTVSGMINGECDIFNVYENFSFNSDLGIQQLTINHELIGDSRLMSAYNQRQKSIGINADAYRGDMHSIEIDGDYKPSSNDIRFDVKLNKLRLSIFNPYTRDIFSNLKGLASGDFEVAGNLKKPLVNGTIDLNKASFEVNYLQTKYSFSDRVEMKDNNILFKDLNVFDPNGNVALANGNINSNYLKEFTLNLTFEAKNFLFLNTSFSDNPDFYGTAYASGRVEILGPTSNLTFNIKAKTQSGTRFYIPLETSEEVAEYNFVRFKTPTDQKDEENIEQKEYKVDLSSLRLNFDLEVTPEAEAQLIFDSTVGDIIRGRGYGNLRLNINTLGQFNMYGDYYITEGDYLFTLQNIINKKFRVEDGSYISWNGDPMDANLNLKAVYSTKSSLTNLFPEESDKTSGGNFYAKRIPVECQLYLSERLVNPQIKFGIFLPTADPDTRSRVESSINTEEELSKHFLSLLVINSFMVDPNKIPTGTDNAALASGPNPLGVTTSELFSNQLSHWLSQMSSDFDIGVNYRPGDDLTSKELELALSTKILNDRVSINGNLDVGGKPTETRTTETSNIVGDFNVDFKINRNVHLKAFNKANDNLIYYSEYTQGIGIFYREEFDTLDELFLKYFAKLGFNGKARSEN